MDRNSSSNLLYYPFRVRLETGLSKARANGLSAYLFEGFRYPERQQELYDQGRKIPGPIVTNARPFQEWHQYGLAGDVVFGGPGKWTWNGDYDKLATLLKAEGLEWAGDWQHFTEKPHFQLTLGMDLGTAWGIYQAHGIIGVWDAMDQLLKKLAVPGQVIS